jgi:hypothetical protein
MAEDSMAQQAFDSLDLPHVQTLIQEWCVTAEHIGEATTFNTPDEYALAHILGWRSTVDGSLPLAAWEGKISDQACAWMHLCHIGVGMERVSLQPVGAQDLDEASSLALLEALRPWAEADGIELMYQQPNRWLAKGDVFNNAPWASLNRVAHRGLDGWLPDMHQHPHAKILLRLQNEAQMLFYTHPINDARQSSGLTTIQGLWISGTGRCARIEAPEPHIHFELGLQAPARQGNWALWTSAWQELDKESIKNALKRSYHGEKTQVIFCGEKGWRAWSPPGVSPKRWWPSWRAWRMVLGRAKTRPTTVLCDL